MNLYCGLPQIHYDLTTSGDGESKQQLSQVLCIRVCQGAAVRPVTRSEVSYRGKEGPSASLHSSSPQPSAPWEMSAHPPQCRVVLKIILNVLLHHGDVTGPRP